MKKNTQVETAQKSQATDKNTGKVKTLKNAQERRKAREEQFRNFRINALRRRCKRMGFSDEKIEELVKKLIEQMNAPKEYDILIMFNPKDFAMLNEALAKANIQYRYKGDTYMSIGGDQNVLAKIREIAPPGAKIFPYAKKMESVLPKAEPKVKKSSNNTAEKKTAAKTASNGHMPKSKRALHRMQKGRTKTLTDIRRAYKSVKKNLKKGEKIDIKKVFKVAEERQKGGAGIDIQLNAKKSSKGSKKASINLKKAA